MTQLYRTIIIVAVALFISYLPGFTNAQCARPRIRKSLDSLTTLEMRAFNRGFLTLKRIGVLDRMTRLHRSGMQYHGTPHFFLMHRALMTDFENELLRVEPTLTGLPYWDELREGSGVTRSDVFTSARLSPIRSGPLTGPYSGLRDDSNRLVTRNPPATSSYFNWLPPNQVLSQALLTMGNFADLSRLVEVSPHNQFHVLIGGHMGNPSISPSDPAFWVHHCYIDLLWALWQSLRAQNRENLRGFGASSPAINPAASVVLYNGRWSNRDMLLYQSRLCYQYRMPSTRARRLKRRSDVQPTTKGRCHKKTASKPFFKPMGQVPEEAIKLVMPCIAISEWRKIENELNSSIDNMNAEIASGQRKPEDYPTIERLFVKSGMNCTSPAKDDDYEDSLIPEVQSLAQHSGPGASLSSSSPPEMTQSLSLVGMILLALVVLLFV